MRNRSGFLALAAVSAMLSGCLDAGSLTGSNPCLAPRLPIPALNVDTVRSATGLKYLVARQGTGTATAGSRSQVTVAFAAYLTDGTLFGQSNFSVFQLPEMIPGFREGVTGMKVGEMRRLIVPPSLGYGASGAGVCVPPNATLIFDVSLIETVA